MAAALAQVKEEWHRFREDSPGERFRNHRERMKHKSKKHTAVTIALGVLLLAGGVVLLFMPGPGLLLIVFGLALVGSHSKKISTWMDRVEPILRDKVHRLKEWWSRRTPRQKIGIIAALLVLATVALNGIWKWVIAGYILA